MLDVEYAISSNVSQAPSEVEDYIAALILREAVMDAELSSPANSHLLFSDASFSDERPAEEGYFYPQFDGQGCKVFVVL
eukprot:515285-Rhodomonas_salina.2